MTDPSKSAYESEATDPFDPKRLRLPQRFSPGSTVRPALLTVHVRKPNPQEFYRVHPDENWRLTAALIELGAEREFYLVVPELSARLSKECKARLLYPTIDRRGVSALWPVRVPDENDHLDSWSRSAHEAALLATEHWVRTTSDRALGAYQSVVATGDFPDPVWPTELSFRDLLEIAFKSRVIDDIDHPVLRRLRGEI